MVATDLPATPGEGDYYLDGSTGTWYRYRDGEWQIMSKQVAYPFVKAHP